MKQTAIATLALVASSLIGCASAEEDSAPSDELAQQQQQALTVTECAAQRDACLNKNPLFGLFTCPGQYAQCTATASNGLPAEVSAAIADAAECTSAALSCVSGARGATATALCAENEAQCVAAIVDVELPTVVEGTAACIDSSVTCIRASKKVSDLANCATSLSGCAVEQVQAVVPAEVGRVVRDVSACRTGLESCISEADSATALASCSEQGAVCVADGLNVTLPDVPVADVVHCAEAASDCALQAASVRAVTACATGLTSCASDVVGSVDVPEQLTCEQKWTACVAKNPLNFPTCTSDLTNCQD